MRNFGMNISAEQHLADYKILRQALPPEQLVIGPDYGIQGCVHESSDRCTAFDKIVSLLGETDPPLVNLSTFHYCTQHIFVTTTLDLERKFCSQHVR